MAIYEFTTMEEVVAIPDPKQVWDDLGRIEVRTGDDMTLPPVEKVTSISSLQGKLALSHFGLAEAFVTWQRSLDPIADFEVIAYLDEATTWRIDSQMVSLATSVMGITKEQTEMMFAFGATLEP